MARPLRIEYPGAWYHVMNRGSSRRAVFGDDSDRALFLDLLGQADSTYALEVHGYCLMDNHYHLLVRTPRGNLSNAMRYVDGLYTQRFNRRHEKDGALFRGRYTAFLVDADEYLLVVSRYIHLNPVEAGLTQSPGDFPWSSYGAYVGRAVTPRWLRIDAVLDMFGRRGARARYESFVDQGIDEPLRDFYSAKRKAPVLGGEAFVESLSAYRSNEAEIPQRRSLDRIACLDDVIEAVTHAFAVPAESVTRRGRGNDARSVAILLCRSPGGIALRTIADTFGVGHYSSISASCRRLVARLEREPALAARYDVARQRLVTVMSKVKT